MSPDQIIFAGVDLSSGRKPVTFAALDGELHILTLEKWSLPDLMTQLNQYPLAVLAVNSSRPDSALAADLKHKLAQAAFKPYSRKGSAIQWIETDAQECFRTFIGHGLFPHRTLEGRIQRALILYDEGLQIPDPMDFFEEITRHRLMQGVLPLENIHTSRQLDAIMAAYMAWLTMHRPGQVEMQSGNMVRPIVQIEEMDRQL